MVKGEVKQGAFEVQSLFMAPPEEAEETEQTYPGVDFFGGQVPTKIQSQLIEWEKANSEMTVYVFSDLLLDNPQVAT